MPKANSKFLKRQSGKNNISWKVSWSQAEAWMCHNHCYGKCSDFFRPMWPNCRSWSPATILGITFWVWFDLWRFPWGILIFKAISLAEAFMFAFLLHFNKLQSLSHSPCKTSNPSSGVGQVCIRDCHHRTLLIFNKEELWWGGNREGLDLSNSHYFAQFAFVFLCLALASISTGDIAGHTNHLLCTAAFHSNPLFLSFRKTLFQKVVFNESKRLFGFQSADSKTV